MPLNQEGLRLVGSELSQVLVPSAVYTAGTYRVGIVSVAGSHQQLGLKSGAPTGATGDILYSAGEYLHLIIDVTVPNGGTLTVTIVGMDPASGKAYTLLVSTGITTAVTTVLRVGPGLTAAANLVANDVLPLMWQVQAVVATASMTFTIGTNQMI